MIDVFGFGTAYVFYFAKKSTQLTCYNVDGSKTSYSLIAHAAVVSLLGKAQTLLMHLVIAMEHTSLIPQLRGYVHAVRSLLFILPQELL